ncbi:N-acyl homoserine lactonase family protein [Oceanibacterium hippocampi]|uniref:N-acyl homoserine lactonase n=1 Tax=Oceanibacterium hippocampi TaxID=745714 RepID=A0A1Y5TJA1_9PROT|nr:N-acyl homoserine lactonase family protein [Oceanibacterium hippocampi]SLN65445.1 N-acyl homoserine lactonase [Oceanibacterium hippocampi]
MSRYTIHPLCVGAIHNFEKSTLTYLGNVGTKVSIPLIIWAIVGENRVILMDSGPDDPAWVRANLDRVVEREPGMDPVSALARIGIAADQIDTVVISHLHWDHSGSLELYPNAEILVQREELAYANCPAPCFCRTYAAPIGGHSPSWHRVARRIRPVTGDFTLAPGIDVLHLPGHSPGMQGLSVATANGRIVLGSDTFNLFENFEQGVPPTIHTDIDAWFRSLERVRAITDTVLPAHDMKVLERASYGA